MTEYSALKSLLCPECAHIYNADELQTFCGGWASPLLVQYDLDALQSLSKDAVRKRPKSLWRWHELLPLKDPHNRTIICEGDSPLLNTPRLDKSLGTDRLYIKDKSGQSKSTFKARGLALAVSKAIELGVEEFVIATAGNAGSALAAYGRERAREHTSLCPGTRQR